MKTTVVNIHKDLFDVYIGRAGHGQPGTFGNPFRPGESVMPCLERYRGYLLARVANDTVFREQVMALRGKRLGCFCAPKGGLPAEPDCTKAICHGQIIAAWIDLIAFAQENHQ